MHTISVTISGLEPGLMMNSLKIANFISGSVIPDEIKKKGIKDLRGW